MLRQLLPGLIGGLIAVALGAIAIRTQRGADITREGWRRLRPGFVMHVALGGSLIMASIVIYFLASGGSARRDADEENLYAMLFGAACLLAAGWSLWVGYLRVIEWSGSLIRVRSPLGERQVGFSQIVGLDESFDGSQTVVRLEDGSAVRIDRYSHGARELVRAIQKHFARRMPDLKTSPAPVD